MECSVPAWLLRGGEGGIRTPDSAHRGIPDFESGPFDHSGTSPLQNYNPFRVGSPYGGAAGSFLAGS